MKQTLAIAQIIVSLLLIACVLLQQEKGGVFKSEGRFYRTLRGLEKKIFLATMLLGAAFVILALVNLVS